MWLKKELLSVYENYSIGIILSLKLRINLNHAMIFLNFLKLMQMV
jgi:hypothetical protein